MARLKKSSRVLEIAERRSAAMSSISSFLDLGTGLTSPDYAQVIAEMRTTLAAYNASLSVVDQSRVAMLTSERKLSDLSERMLMAIAVKYGKDSIEYEMAGGVRKSNRKRPVRVAKTADGVAVKANAIAS